MEEYILFLCVLIEATVLAFLLTPVAMKLAKRWDVMDHPSEARKIHRAPTPYLGGMAIFGAFILVICGNLGVFLLLSQTDFVRRLLPLAEDYREGILTVGWRLIGFLGGAVLIFLVGLIDDVKGMSPRTKLGGQFLAAGFFWVFLSISEGEAFRFLIDSPWISIPAMLIWIVVVMNSFNLIDNMDGLSGGVAAIAAFFFAGVCYLVEGQTFLILSYLALLGAILGFLYHNWSPARIFMGDAGSLFLGYALAALAVMSQYVYEGERHHLVLFVPAVILSLPMFDTLSVIAIRVKRGLPVWKADKNHFSHRLVDIGLAHRDAVLLIYLVTFCTGLVALLLPLVSLFAATLILLQMAILFTIVLLLERAGAAKQDNFAPMVIGLLIVTIVVVLVSLSELRQV